MFNSYRLFRLDCQTTFVEKPNAVTLDRSKNSIYDSIGIPKRGPGAKTTDAFGGIRRLPLFTARLSMINFTTYLLVATCHHDFQFLGQKFATDFQNG